MRYLETYLNKIRARGNIKLADSISETAEDVGGAYLMLYNKT